MKSWLKDLSLSIFMKNDDIERRRFWASLMDEMEALERKIAAPVEECGEPLGSIPDAMEEAKVEVLFSDTKIAGTFDRIYFIRESLLPDLVASARDMNEKGWILKIEDGFRTEEMQTRLGRARETFDQIVRTCRWENGGEIPPVDLVFRRAHILVANCGKTGTHTQGAAVDISVFHRDDGSELWRGAPYLEMSELTAMRSPFVTREEHDHRMAITEIMERHSFMHFSGEFWHYDQGDSSSRISTQSGKPGRYGPVHWDPGSNSVTPYHDPLRLFTSMDQFQIEIKKVLSRVHS